MIPNHEPRRVALLSQTQACALSKLFETMSASRSPGYGEVANIYDQLSDSLWIARWLGGNVHLELGVTETASVVRIVLTMMDECPYREEDSQALLEVIQQLSTAPSSPPVMDACKKTPMAALLLDKKSETVAR